MESGVAASSQTPRFTRSAAYRNGRYAWTKLLWTTRDPSVATLGGVDVSLPASRTLYAVSDAS